MSGIDPNIEQIAVAVGCKNAIALAHDRNPWLGDPTGDPVPEPAPTIHNTGMFQHFKNGSIYCRNTQTVGQQAYVVHGAIRDKWSALGWETSFLGFPTSSERSTPNDQGRYNHFEGGSIYWTPETGACVVHGAIRDKWAELGGEASFLGFPTTDELEFPDNGRVSVFQHGAIYWWADTGAIELTNVAIVFKGLHCFGETDVDPLPVDSMGSDEPYVVMNVIAPDGSKSSLRSPIYNGLERESSRPDYIEIYRGKPLGVIFGAVLMEHNTPGNEAAVQQIVQQGLDQGAAALSAAATLIPYVGPAISLGIALGYKAVKDDVVGALVRLTSDSQIGPVSQFNLGAKELITLAGLTSEQTDKAISFKLASPLLEGRGASYKVYFSVVRV